MGVQLPLSPPQNFLRGVHMVKFEFILTDHEAESLMSAVQSQIEKLHISILDEMVDKNRQAYIDAYNASIEYYKTLKSKLKNTRVEE